MHQRGGRVGRIIPACAGSTAANWSRTRCGRDHPRMRGEHRIAADTPQLFVGSSPHARGAPDLAHRPHARLGIIPACAGSTSGTTRCPSARRDHPRMRGEHRLACSMPIERQGSSPHARGALVVFLVQVEVVGIIPACAGSTTTNSFVPFSCRDHPRMRGEHHEAAILERLYRGSSPHARGARAEDVPVVPVEGIIPACAGSTLEYLRLCPGLKRITLTLPITSEAGKWTEKHPNDQLMPRAFRPSR